MRKTKLSSLVLQKNILPGTAIASAIMLAGCGQTNTQPDVVSVDKAPEAKQTVMQHSEASYMAAQSFLAGKETQNVASVTDIDAMNKQAPTAAGEEARTAFVHLFEWRHADVAQECEDFLGPKGFSAVQVSPPNEHRVMYGYPDVSWAAPGTWSHSWAQRYQPVSYSLNSRSGTEAEFIDMVQRCNAVGVGIYVDAVINHMTGTGAGCRTGSGGSQYCSNTSGFPGLDPSDFHADCGGDIDYSNAWQVQNCYLSGLMDLNTGNPSTQQKIANYLNYLTSLGVAGFRFDASKHMHKDDIAGIISRLNGSPYIFQEVIDMGGDEPIKEWHYHQNGNVTDFEYGKIVNDIVRYGDIQDFGNAAKNTSYKSVVFTDNHDNQRGHGAGSYNSSGTPGVLTFYSGDAKYKLGNVAMLAWPYGYPKIMSSYDWVRNITWKDGKMKDVNDWIGPPSDTNGNTNGVECFTPRSGNWDNVGASGGWMCEHRWRQIANMVGWRNAVNDCWKVTDWQSEPGTLAFGRCGNGFVAVNQQGSQINRWYQTAMSEGDYCDVISGELTEDGTGCTGNVVHVNGDGTANFVVGAEDSMAIHRNQKVSTPIPDNGNGDGDGGDTGGLQRTVVMIYGVTQSGQDMFIRGGIDHGYASSIGRDCSNNTAGNDCSLGIEYRNSRKQETKPSEYAWQLNDTHLDWYGVQAGQVPNAEGTALSWTVDAATAAGWGMTETYETHGYGISNLNTYGPHMWLLDVMMDCSNSVDGWFEVKSYITNGPGWEPDVTQAGAPYSSGNHFAKCGKKNVFWRGSSNAEISDL